MATDRKCTYSRTHTHLLCSNPYHIFTYHKNTQRRLICVYFTHALLGLFAKVILLAFVCRRKLAHSALVYASNRAEARRLKFPVELCEAGMAPVRKRPAANVGDAPQRRVRPSAGPSVGHLALGVAVVGVAAGLGAAPATSGAEWRDAFLTEEGLEKEDAQRRKAVYLVTLPHPCVATSEGNGLKAPGDFTREEIANMILDIFDAPSHIDAASEARGETLLALQRFVVFREPHKPDAEGRVHDHYHVALVASGSFRFMAYKRALRSRYNLASHWSCSHEGYWSAVRYGVMPTPTKPSEGLDDPAKVVAWPKSHPPLMDAAQEPTTAAALLRRRNNALKEASSEGAKEPRATEMDLYPIIVREGFRNTDDAPWPNPFRLCSVLFFASSFIYFAFNQFTCSFLSKQNTCQEKRVHWFGAWAF